MPESVAESSIGREGSRLPRTTFGVATDHGIRKRSAGSVQRNGPMRRLNERLGHIDRGVGITARRSLPISG